MNDEDLERDMTLEQLSQLLSAVQVMGRKLANESHGRSYDRVREFNEILHRARMHLHLIERDAPTQPGQLLERRRTARRQSGSDFGALGGGAR